MHELAIAESIADVVATRAAACHASRVKSVRLRIGEASGIVSESLTFCFEMVTSADPMLAGARLAIEPMPHRARCRNCDADFPVVSFVAQCPTCGEWSGEIVSGTELQVLDMEIDSPSETEPEMEPGQRPGSE